MLTLYQRLVELRHSSQALAVRSHAPIGAHGDVLAYTRQQDDQCFVIALNLGSQSHTIDLAARNLRGRIVLPTQLDREGETVAGTLDLRGDDDVVITIDQ